MAARCAEDDEVARLLGTLSMEEDAKKEEEKKVEEDKKEGGDKMEEEEEEEGVDAKKWKEWEPVKGEFIKKPPTVNFRTVDQVEDNERLREMQLRRMAMTNPLIRHFHKAIIKRIRDESERAMNEEPPKKAKVDPDAPR